VIADFVASWPLFGDTYLAGWLVAGLLSLAGVWVVARDQIFLGAAVSQASTLGIAVAIWVQGVTLAHALQSDALPFLLAVSASVGTALISALPQRSGGESAEAITGWVFLLGGSLPVLLLAHSPHGLEEVHRLLFSSILGASRADVWIFVGLAIVSVAGVARFGRHVVLFAVDPEMAAAVGMGKRRWTVLTALWLGTTVGVSLHAAGMIYTFGCLVLPSLFARQVCREVRQMWVVAPVVGVGTALVSFVVAHRLDVPPAQLTVALLCALLGLAWLGTYARVRLRAPDSS